MTTGAQELVAQVRSKRSLPPPEERRRIRKAAGVSLRQMGDALGVAHTVVAAWEKKGFTPREKRDVYAQLLADLKRAVE